MCAACVPPSHRRVADCDAGVAAEPVRSQDGPGLARTELRVAFDSPRSAQRLLELQTEAPSWGSTRRGCPL